MEFVIFVSFEIPKTIVLGMSFKDWKESETMRIAALKEMETEEGICQTCFESPTYQGCAICLHEFDDEVKEKFP